MNKKQKLIISFASASALAGVAAITPILTSCSTTQTLGKYIDLNSTDLNNMYTTINNFTKTATLNAWNYKSSLIKQILESALPKNLVDPITNQNITIDFDKSSFTGISKTTGKINIVFSNISSDSYFRIVDEQNLKNSNIRIGANDKSIVIDNLTFSSTASSNNAANTPSSIVTTRNFDANTVYQTLNNLALNYSVSEYQNYVSTNPNLINGTIITALNSIKPNAFPTNSQDISFDITSIPTFNGGTGTLQFVVRNLGMGVGLNEEVDNPNVSVTYNSENLPVISVNLQMYDDITITNNFNSDIFNSIKSNGEGNAIIFNTLPSDNTPEKKFNKLHDKIALLFNSQYSTAFRINLPQINQQGKNGASMLGTIIISPNNDALVNKLWGKSYADLFPTNITNVVVNFKMTFINGDHYYSSPNSIGNGVGNNYQIFIDFNDIKLYKNNAIANSNIVKKFQFNNKHAYKLFAINKNSNGTDLEPISLLTIDASSIYNSIVSISKGMHPTQWISTNTTIYNSIKDLIHSNINPNVGMGEISLTNTNGGSLSVNLTNTNNFIFNVINNNSNITITPSKITINNLPFSNQFILDEQTLFNKLNEKFENDTGAVFNLVPRINNNTINTYKNWILEALKKPTNITINDLNLIDVKIQKNPTIDQVSNQTNKLYSTFKIQLPSNLSILSSIDNPNVEVANNNIIIKNVKLGNPSAKVGYISASAFKKIETQLQTLAIQVINKSQITKTSFYSLPSYNTVLSNINTILKNDAVANGTPVYHIESIDVSGWGDGARRNEYGWVINLWFKLIDESGRNVFPFVDYDYLSRSNAQYSNYTGQWLEFVGLTTRIP